MRCKMQPLGTLGGNARRVAFLFMLLTSWCGAAPITDGPEIKLYPDNPDEDFGGDDPEPDAGSRSLQVPVDCLPHNYLLQDVKVLSVARLREAKASPACLNSVSDTALHQLQRRIAKVQEPDDCASSEHMTVTLYDAGWGSTVHGALKPLMHAIMTGTLLHSPRTMGWTRNECRSRGLDCIFKSFSSSCTEGKYEAAGGDKHSTHYQVVPDNDIDNLVRMEASPIWYPGAKLTLGWNYSYLEHGETVIPDEFRQQGWFWYTSQLAGFALRPDERLQDALDLAMDTSGLGHALSRGLVLGLHVRQGDACADAMRTGRQCDGLETYMQEVEKMRNESGVSTILLQTDSDKVRMKAKTQYPQYSWLMWDGAKEHDKQVFAEHKTNNWDKIMEQNTASGNTRQSEETARLAMVATMLLAKSDMFVGKFSSNFFRLAYELKAADCNCIVPFSSLDAAWCFDYAAPAGRSRFQDSRGKTISLSFMC